MQVTGKNLLNVSKLLLSLGKDEANDKLFEMENLTGNNNYTRIGGWDQPVIFTLARLFNRGLDVGEPPEGAGDDGVWVGCGQAAGELPCATKADVRDGQDHVLHREHSWGLLRGMLRLPPATKPGRNDTNAKHAHSGNLVW